MIILAVILCMLLLTGCGIEEMDLESAQVVRIVCEGQSGSGVIYEAVEDQVIVVTAAHVVRDAEKAKVVWGKESVNNIEIADIVIVPDLDLAFLRIGNADAKWSARQNMPGSEKDDLDEIFLRGCNAAGELIEISGNVLEEWIYVEDFGCHMMVGNAGAAPGMSGGGVFDEAGIFYGIVCGMDEDNNVAILPASVISSEYDVIVWE